MSNDRPATRRPAWLLLAVGGALGQLICGLALTWPIVSIQKTADESISTMSLVSEALVTSAFLVAGLGAGLGAALTLRRRIWPVLLWSVGLLGLSGVLWAWSFHPALIGLLGFCTGFSLSLGEYVVRSTSPNLRRMMVIGLLNYSFAAFGLLFLILTVAASPATSRILAVLVAVSAAALMGIFQFARWSMFQKLALLESSCGSKLVAAAQPATPPATANSQDHDHDHDHDHKGDGGCGEEECCGGVMESITAPRWTGVLISASGWLLLLGPVVCSLLVIGNSESWRLTKLAAIGCAMLMGIRIVRVGAAQFGNTIILAPLLVLMAITSLPAVFAFAESWWQIAALAVWTGTCSSVFQASRDLATEYFPDGGRQRGRVLVPVCGPALAGLILLVFSTLPEAWLWYGLTIGIPALAFAVCLTGLRGIPQPMISTGFATRMTKDVSQGQPC